MNKLRKFGQERKVLTREITVDYLDTIHASSRSILCNYSELRRIAGERYQLAIKEGWTVLKRKQLSELVDGQEIRCFAAYCGCIGQVEYVRKEGDYLHHSLHNVPFAKFHSLYPLFSLGVKGNIMIKKD